MSCFWRRNWLTAYMCMMLPNPLKTLFFFFSLHEQTSAGLPSCSFKPGTQVPQPEVFGCAAGFSTQHIPTCSHLYIFYILPNLHFVGSALQTFSIAKGKLTAHASLNFILRPGACHRAWELHTFSVLALIEKQSNWFFPAPLFQCAVCLSGPEVVILVFISSQF